ncbi:hypothetical protein KM043_016126 [Ampulex compressa]|nr:hypothetical protein KM043_016126 [Ampulex compressa]
MGEAEEAGEPGRKEVETDEGRDVWSAPVERGGCTEKGADSFRPLESAFHRPAGAFSSCGKAPVAACVRAPRKLIRDRNKYDAAAFSRYRRAATSWEPRYAKVSRN